MPNQSQSSSQRKEITGQMKTAHKSSRLKQQMESLSQMESSQFSQSWQTMVTRMQASEAAREMEESQVMEFSEICERQQQNQSELLCQNDRLELRYDTEMKHQDAILTKYNKVIQMFNILGARVNTVTDCLQKTADIQTAYGKTLASHKAVLHHLHRSYETMCNVSIPRISELYREHLNQRMKSDCSVEKEKELNDNCKQNEFEETLKEENLSQLKARPCDINNQVSAENTEIDKMTNNEVALLKEKRELKQSLKSQVESLSAKDNRTEHDIQVASTEKGTSTLKTKNLQIELLQRKEREGSLCVALQPIKTSVENLSGSLSKKQASVTELSKLLDVETKNSLSLKKELDGISLQLQDIERNFTSLIDDLSKEVLKISADAAETELYLEKELNNAKQEEADILKEDENVLQSLVHMKTQLKDIQDAYSQACQSIAAWESDSVNVARELTKLKDEERTLNEHLAAVRYATQITEQSLIQIEAVHDKTVCEFENQLVCSEQENSHASAELESLTSMEEKLNTQIVEAKRVSAYSDTEMKEHNENIVKEMQVQIAASEKEIDSINADWLKKIDELQQNLKHLIEAVEKRNTELNNYKDSLQKCRKQSEDLKSFIKTKMEQKEKQEKIINDLTSEISQYSEREEHQIIEGQTVALKLQQVSREINQTDSLISSLEIKLQQVLSETEKAATDHKVEKQIFMRDLVNFQQTAECRRDEERSLLKQRTVWKAKYEESEQQVPEMCSALVLKKQEASQAHETLTKLKSEMKNAKERQVKTEKTLKNSEKEAHQAKKRMDHLKNKILAHKAARKKEQERAADAFNLLSQEVRPTKPTTPQQLATLKPAEKEITPLSILKPNEKEITPRSILKSSSKPPTPLKTVKFVDDLDECASSSSSIVMVPEVTDRIASNPGALREILAEHRERKHSKWMLKQQDSNCKVFKAPSQELAPSNNTTPKSTSLQNKENVFDPQTQLSKKSPTAGYESDFDDGASSSSSIVMVPELTDRIASNPGAFRQIMAEHQERQRLAKAEKRKLKQQEIDNELYQFPSNDTVPSRNTTPQFVSGPDGKEITPRSILKSASNPPTPQKKSVQFVDDLENASSTSSSMVDPEHANRREFTPTHMAKRMKLSHWADDTTHNEISSSTPEK
ncbi:synaptonemal complex protein ZIP1-like [Thrips palmi]|uniref:Synaptonemal complex protein ZIP1-like n=1 Tax=Thrips palmi TaxID=161013 RepID=A0A6P9AKP6_THRPL|nr:synaptonemal complex protein ZIP1-like [Thrips palmi]